MPRGAFRSSLLLVGTLGMADASGDPAVQPGSLQHHHPGDPEGVASVVQRWVEAWRKGDGPGMAACLHPDLDRRVLEASEGQGAPLRTVGDLMGVQATLGRSVKGERPPVVRVLDLLGRSASVRVELGAWTALVHLAAHGEGWGIASILWQWQAPGTT